MLMQIFRFVSQRDFIQLQQSYKVDKVLMCLKEKKKANKQNKQIDAYECVDAYHIYEIPRQLLLK